MEATSNLCLIAD